MNFAGGQSSTIPIYCYFSLAGVGHITGLKPYQRDVIVHRISPLSNSFEINTQTREKIYCLNHKFHILSEGSQRSVKNTLTGGFEKENSRLGKRPVRLGGKKS